MSSATMMTMLGRRDCADAGCAISSAQASTHNVLFMTRSLSAGDSTHVRSITLTLAEEAFGRSSAPRSLDRIAHERRFRVAQRYHCAALLSPRSRRGSKCVAADFDEELLILTVEHDHAKRPVRSERREDSAPDPEIGMVHMRGFDRFRKTQRNLAELSCSH